MVGSSQGFSFQSIETQKVYALYANVRKGQQGEAASQPGANPAAGNLEDILDIGNSSGKLPGYETVLSILEEKVTGRIDKAFSGTEEVESQEDYWSPEKTAGRIAEFALKYYDAFAEAKGGESEETLDEFLGIVKGAIDQGIGEAREIIGGFTSDGKVPEETQGTIMKTRAHIEELLNAFREEAMKRIRGEGQGEDEEQAEEEPKVEEIVAA